MFYVVNIKNIQIKWVYLCVQVLIKIKNKTKNIKKHQRKNHRVSVIIVVFRCDSMSRTFLYRKIEDRYAFC